MIHRVRDRATFLALRRGRRARAGPVTVAFVAGERPPRVAYGVGRQVGPAVTRNRVRRRLRAIVRDLDRDEALHGGAYLVSVGAAAADLSHGELRHSVSSAMDQLTPDASR